MYNYIANISKSTAVTHCLSCNFFTQEKRNLILSKNDILEFYDLTKEGLVRNTCINIFGKIELMLSIPSHDKNDKDNLFILSEDLDFALFSYNHDTNHIDTVLNGSINEEIGRKQDGVLYCLDLMKNFLILSAFKNVFKLLCVNIEMRTVNKYRDFTIKYLYEDILFLTPFSLNYFFNSNKQNHYKNILTFAAIKTDVIDNTNNATTDTSSNELPQEISLETFQILTEPNDFKYYTFLWKNDLIHAVNIDTNEKDKKDENSYNLEDVNLLQKIDLSENPTVSLMITHPDGLIILFFSNYIQYYRYEPKKKKLMPKKDKKISYEERKFTNYTIIDEKNYKYFVIDEYGNLFLLVLILPFSEEKNKTNLIFQFLGEINYSTCLAYLDNNYLFVGSNKANSQLIKIEKNNNNFINVIENYDTLAPISNLTLVNKNIENENHVDLITISGIEKNCCVNMIKKGIPAIFEDELEIKNIKNVFKVSLSRNNTINTFIISTINNSFILDYDPSSNKLSLNNLLNLDKKEIIAFGQTIYDNSVLLLVSMKSIILYHINDNNVVKLTQRKNFNDMDQVKPQLIKYNERLNSVFIYFNNKVFMSFKIDSNGQISSTKEILDNINMSSFGVCKYFIIYSEWDKNNLGIYTINTGKKAYMNIVEPSKDFAQITSIEIIKVEGLRFILLSLSNGKLLYFKLKEQFRNYNYYDFNESDFVFKRKYNLTNENYTIRKIKIKDNTDRKYLYLDMSTPCLAFFNKEAIVLLNLSIKSCKNIIQLEKNKYLFIYNHKISFGSLSNVQSQNITSKLYGKQLYNIETISFDNNYINISNDNTNKENIVNFNQEKNKQKISNYLLTINEEKIDKNISKTSLVLSDIYLKEISRYDFQNENEICTSFCEIQKNNDIDNKIIVAGTGISEYPNEEPNMGYIYLIEIDYKNNYVMNKIKEIQTKGGIYKIKAFKNIIYASIGNTLFIYKIIKNYETKKLTESYEIKLIRKCNHFTLINDIYIYDYDPKIDEKDLKLNMDNNILKSEKKIQKDKMEEEEEFNKINDYSEEEHDEIKSEENKSKNEEDLHYIIISDLYRSIVLYSYDANNDKLSEICRDYNLTWVYSISQLKNNLLYISDIDGNIVSLEKNIHPKSDQENFKFERRAYFNLSERINSIMMTTIKNPKLFLLSSENNKYNIIEAENIDDNIPEDVNVSYYGTMEGSVGVIISLKKEVYDFLKELECAIVKKMNNFGNFNYEKWRSFKDGFNVKKAVGFVEGNIVEDFLNYDDNLKNNLINEIKFPWDKSLSDVVNIIETLAKCH